MDTTISEQNTEHGTGTVAHVIQFSTQKQHNGTTTAYRRFTAVITLTVNMQITR